MKKINILASLSTRGGGEQAIVKISSLLRQNGWKVYLIPWDKVHNSYDKNELRITNYSFKNGMKENMKKNIPLLFYANDGAYAFNREEDYFKNILEKSSCLILGINFVAGGLQTSQWIKKTGKLAGVIFLNNEKKEGWKKHSIYDKNVPLKVLHPVIDLDNIIKNTGQVFRRKTKEMIILRHSTGDSRKFVNDDNIAGGNQIYPWQKFIPKKTDIEMYQSITKISEHIKCMFMIAPSNLIVEYQNNSQFKFYKWDEIPVDKFLNNGHVFLYRTSNHWNDQGPRSVTEAIAAGLPVLTEPRSGLRDRVKNGYNGFHCTQTEDFILKCKMFYENEELRFEMAKNSRYRARKYFKTDKWVKTITEMIDNYV